MIIRKSTGCHENDDEGKRNREACEARRQQSRYQILSSNDDSLLAGSSSCLARFVDMVQAEHIFRSELVVVYCVVWGPSVSNILVKSLVIAHHPRCTTAA